MSARDVILARIREARPVPVERPVVHLRVSKFVPQAEAARNFIVASEAASARVVTGRRTDLAALVASAYPTTGRLVSAMPQLDAGAMAESPHSFADTEVFVCEAVLGVAENGAVWLPLSRLRQRSALLLATKVIVVLDRTRIVSTLHDAYAMIDVTEDGFGLFVAGPSKTADIEQALVIGAHGAKSLTILLLEE
jgi:L-lactate dehydrogenase complex protein LldG